MSTRHTRTSSRQVNSQRMSSRYSQRLAIFKEVRGTRKSIIPENLEKNVSSFFLAAMGVCMLVALLCRHFFPAAHPYALGAAGSCLAWFSLIGMARAAAKGLHTHMNLLPILLSPGSAKRLSIFSDVAFMVFFFMTFIISCFVIVVSIQHDKPISTLLILLVLPIGSILSIIRLHTRIGSTAREIEDMIREEMAREEAQNNVY